MMIFLTIFFLIILFFNWNKFLQPFTLFILSWILYIGIKLLYEFSNGRNYKEILYLEVLLMSVSFLIGYVFSKCIFNLQIKKNINFKINYIPKNNGLKLLSISVILIFIFTVYLLLLGVKINQITSDSLAIRWLLGNGGNNFLTQLILVPLSVIPVIYFWNIEKIKPLIGFFIIIFCFYYFYVLGIRGVIVDWIFSFITITSFKNNTLKIPFKKILTFAISALFIISFIGIIRFNSQLENNTAVKNIETSSAIILASDLFFERLDFLDVLNAYFKKVELGQDELKLPSIPFISMFLPRSIVKEKLFPTDTQVTKLSGDGFDQENITRIVGPLPELYKIGGNFAVCFWYFIVGMLFYLINFKLLSAKTGSLFQKVYSKQLLQIGSIPLFFGINTIYGTQFIIVTLISILSFIIFE